MKQFSFLLLLLLAGWLLPARVIAQPTGTDSLSQKLTSIFANVDKSQVPTGYLYEAGIRFLEPGYYNGIRSDSNLTDMDVLRYLRAQLRSSRVYGQDTLPGVAAFNARIKGASAAAGGAIPIAVEYMPYASIAPNALQDNLLTVQNEQVYDVAGRSQSPYQTNVLFAAAPALAYSPTNNVSFLFRRNLYLRSAGVVPTLYLDFDDGRGYQLVTWGQALATSYSTAGTKRVKVRAVFSTKVLEPIGTQKGDTRNKAQRPSFPTSIAFESHFDFQVRAVVAASRYGDNGGTSGYLKPTGSPYGAYYSIRYGRGHGANVVKPFVVVEQYNIAGVAPHLIDCNNPNNTVDSFMDKINGVALQSGVTFNESLEAAGYDLVYIDFERNTGDITINARVFERVMQEVNTRKAIAQNAGLTVYGNVVMGMSMGGLIARYGLADMTKNTGPFGAPDTRLLVLHDSPQRGAYNPVGLQSFARSCDVPLNIFEFWKIRDFKGTISDAIDVLDEPATQQLAILNAFNGRGDIRANTFISGDYGDMVDFTRPINAGRPQPAYQIVATSDGSQCGRGSGAPVGVVLSSADTYTSTAGAVLGGLISMLNPISYLGRFSLGVRGAAYGLPAYGQQATISRMRVYIEYRLKIGRCPFCITIPLRFNLLNESATSPPNTLPYETLPGGTTNLDRESGGCGNTTGLVALFLRTSLYNGDICFVPSYSALDVQTVTPATAAVAYLYGAPPQTSAVPRVAKFIAMEQNAGLYNQTHLQFTTRNSQWIFNEMQGLPIAPLNCQAECSGYPTVPITGPANVCPGGSTFSVAPPFGSVTNWTVSPAGLATFTTPTAGATTVGLTPTSGLVGLVTVSATITNGCFSTTASRVLTVGGGIMEINNGRSTPTCATTGIVFDLTTAFGVQGPYTWQTSAGYISSNQGGPSVLIDGLPFQDYQLTVTVSSPSSCPGAPPVQAVYYQDYYTRAPDGSFCQPYRVASGGTGATASLYPNPAKETVDVHIENASAAAPVTVRLFDSYGQPRTEQTSHGETTLRLNTEKLPTGLYFVHILRGQQVLSRQQLRIEK